MSVVATVKQGRFKSDAQAALEFSCEKQLYFWIVKVGDDLKRKLQRKELDGQEALALWKIKESCYRCCQRAVKEGRLP